MKPIVSCDRNAPWLSKIKADWDPLALKYSAAINARILSEKTDTEREIRYIDISSVTSTGRIENIESMKFGNAPSRARRIVQYGDTVVSTVRTYLRAVAPIPEQDADLIASTGFAVVSPRKDVFHPVFLAYWLQSTYFVDEVCARSVGVSYPATNASEVGAVPAPLPPLPTQKAIADYLDEKTAAIDALIEKKRKLLGLLAEERAALINQAVTKGLDPGVPMKDSGIPWIGEVPGHWEVKRLKFIAEVRGGVTKGQRFGGVPTINLPYLRVANVQDGHVVLDDVYEIEVRLNEAGRYQLKPGYILMNEGGDNDKLGRGAVWEGQIDPCLHQNHVFAVRPYKDTNPYWVNLATQSTYLKFYFFGHSKQSTNLASISSSNIKEAPIFWPPRREQEEILEATSAGLGRIDGITSKLAEHVNLLQEYRQSLITAAVTGQLDIEAAA